MPSLQQSDDRFMQRLQVIEGGSGYFKGVIDDPTETVPNQLTGLRRSLRINLSTPVSTGMVIKTLTGSIYILADFADSTNLFRSFRLFEVTGQYTWGTRTKGVDVVTGLAKDSGMIDNGLIYGLYEPTSSNIFDRQLHREFENVQFITNRHIVADDLVDGKRVASVHDALGVRVATLT